MENNELTSEIFLKNGAYNGAQWYEQFLQVCRQYRALILLGLALYLPSTSVSSVFMVLFMYLKKLFAYILLTF